MQHNFLNCCEWRRPAGWMLLAMASHAAWGQTAANIGVDAHSIFEPRSGSAQMLYSMSLFMFAITGAIFVVVGGLWLYVIVRFRETRGDETYEPPQVYGGTQIELAWTVVPILIVVVLFLTTARILFAVQDRPKQPVVLNVDVVGHQFWWAFRYPKFGFVTANELHVPVSDPNDTRTTDLKLLSADVHHSFWVPSLFGKIDSIPNKTNSMWFDPSSTGLYVGQCAQFCGIAHTQMLLRVYVQTPEEFAAWAKGQQQPAVQDPAVAAGRQVFESQACVSCHVVRGTAAHGTFGPDLTHLMSRDTIASGLLPNTPDNLRRWIKDPDSIKPGCLMPAMQLSDTQIDQMVGYLSTLK
jgi:cytochrome c oxidase subunit II